MQTKTQKILNDFTKKIDINNNYTLNELKKLLFHTYDNYNNSINKLIPEKPLLSR